MTIQEFGAIGEVIGAFAVLISLIYLSVQIRINTRSVRSSAYQAAISTISQIPVQIASDRELARITRIGFGGSLSDLDEDEHFRFTMLLTGLFRNFENFYFQYANEAMEEHLWQGMRTSMIGYENLPNVRAWWDARKLIYSPRFVEFLERQARIEASEQSVIVDNARGMARN